ncbi:hypothetical protein ACFW9U_17415 [Rhodococcus aetherivorans]|uniref:hypothetical protein n=1 Tax=Rhodococcus aetherivorans TaxID=191292 RepID=UPI00366F3DE4
MPVSASTQPQNSAPPINTDPKATHPAMTALITLARRDPDRMFEAYDLEVELGVRFERQAAWGVLFRTAHRAGHIEPVGVTISKRPSRAGGLTRVWRAARTAQTV